jgi:hypothetical protein
MGMMMMARMVLVVKMMTMMTATKHEVMR